MFRLTSAATLLSCRLIGSREAGQITISPAIHVVAAPVGVHNQRVETPNAF
jgi:hypothetical protein